MPQPQARSKNINFYKNKTICCKERQLLVVVFWATFIEINQTFCIHIFCIFAPLSIYFELSTKILINYVLLIRFMFYVAESVLRIPVREVIPIYISCILIFYMSSSAQIFSAETIIVRHLT
jgi:hypothetical protein